jgi:NhaP-type Na+/H+ and K+/H+ antiporter
VRKDIYFGATITLMETITLKIKKNCMAPLLKDGDTVTVQRKKKFKTGDVIVYFNENHELVIHRYAKIFGMEKTKADNNMYFDSWAIKKPLGKALLVEPFKRRIKMFFRLKMQLFGGLLRGTF